MKPSLLLFSFLLTISYLFAQNPELNLSLPYNEYEMVDNGFVYVPYYLRKGTGKKNKMEIRKVDLKSGEVKEIFEVPSKYVKETFLYVNIEEGYLYLNYSPVMGMKNYLVKYDLKNKREVWETPFPASHIVNQAPIVYSDHIISKNPKQVFIVDKESGKEIFKAYDAHMGSSIGLMGDRVMVSRFDGTVICTDVQDAKKAYWSLDVGESAGLDPPLYLDNKLYIPSWSAHLYCVDKESGKTLWAYERDDIKQGCGTGFEFQPIPYKDQLLFTHSVEGVFALDRESGRELKNIRLSSGVNQGLMYQDRYLVISSYEYLHIYDAEKMELIKQVKLPFRAVYAVKLDGSKVIIGNPDDAVVRNINRYFEGKLQGENRILVYDLEKLIAS